MSAKYDSDILHVTLWPDKKQIEIWTARGKSEVLKGKAADLFVSWMNCHWPSPDTAALREIKEHLGPAGRRGELPITNTIREIVDRALVAAPEPVDPTCERCRIAHEYLDQLGAPKTTTFGTVTAEAAVPERIRLYAQAIESTVREYVSKAKGDKV